MIDGLVRHSPAAAGVRADVAHEVGLGLLYRRFERAWVDGEELRVLPHGIALVKERLLQLTGTII